MLTCDLIADLNTDDSLNSVAAGALSGAVFRSTKGLKPMLISSGIVASAAGIWAVSNEALTS
jgi:import inner membrane translocase subunit TIM23